MLRALLFGFLAAIDSLQGKRDAGLLVLLIGLLAVEQQLLIVLVVVEISGLPVGEGPLEKRERVVVIVQFVGVSAAQQLGVVDGAGVVKLQHLAVGGRALRLVGVELGLELLAGFRSFAPRLGLLLLALLLGQFFGGVALRRLTRDLRYRSQWL